MGRYGEYPPESVDSLYFPMCETCQLWCAKKAIYIQLWPLGRFKVEKYVKWVVKKLRPSNTTGHTNEAYFGALIS